MDSLYDKSYSFPFSSFPGFDKNTDQIIYISSNVIDITGDYLQDSLKKFTTKKIYRLDSVKQIQYDPRHLLITNEDFDKFSVDGFYYNEKGIRWTNGNASIGFIGDYTITDSIDIELNTYMPPVCKNVTPKVSITDDNNKNYQPVISKREGNKFIFQFYFNRPITIQKINILSETIAAAPPDTRVLSFPFISLEIKKTGD